MVRNMLAASGMKNVCKSEPQRLVVWLLALPVVFSTGCYLQHGDQTDDERDCGRSDWVCCDIFTGQASNPRDLCAAFPCSDNASWGPASECSPVDLGARFSDAGRVDGGPAPVDGGPAPVDAGLHCALERADYSCLDARVAAGQPFELPVSFDGLTCCGMAECAAVVDIDAGRIDLTTTRCPDICECVPDTPGPRTTCSIPALPPGNWQIHVNEQPAFTLPVYVDLDFAPASAACFRFGEEDRCEPRATSSAVSIDQVCLVPEERSGRWLELHLDCAPCTTVYDACEVALERWTSSDRPPGGDLRFSLAQHDSACDVDCPAVCIPSMIRCPIPRLEDDGHYVLRDGEEILRSFQPGELSERECFSR